uniref:TNFR-Cys domain-containing protein n=1 Tax=Monopterus albus TaxID=43700 RepID=A0A3Q3KEE4_MONAL|nr:tumor necrosis factor receptor superfamily member 5-like [Monopterus albus]
MAITCEDEYIAKNGRCCHRCPAGKYVQSDCDSTKTTQCAECGGGFYTATKNYLNKCHVCKDCSSHNNQRKAKDCTATADTVCECVTGFYCSNDQCDHCQQVGNCPPGEGVRLPATRTSNTGCAPCEKGTYSNVTDSFSPCKPHTRCDEIGRVLKIPGTLTTNAICGDIKHHCSFILPAGLWAGFALTVLLLMAVIICMRVKRRSRRAASFSDPVALVKKVPATLATSMELPLSFTEINGHCQESNTMDDCKLSLFNQDDNPVRRSMDSSYPITPLKVSVSFAEPTHFNGCAGHSNFLRTHSEPQEDEWCGT